jgi:uncharacterized membrane protein YecN with MAPEG domain
MASITLLYAGILILLSVLLANQVLYVRLRGDKEPEWRDNTVQRVQSNFIENVPLSLFLLNEHKGPGLPIERIVRLIFQHIIK